MSLPSIITAAHFSPTHGTLKAVRLLTEKMGISTELIDLTFPDVREREYIFEKEDLLMAACPVYAGQIPRVLKLFQNLKGKGTPCILVAAYGNRHYDDALAQMKQILEEQGFVCIAGMACIIPHVFSEILGSGRPDTEDVRIFEDFAKQLCKKLESEDHTPVDFPGNPFPMPQDSKPIAKLRDISSCVLCLSCIQECPTQAIDPVSKQIDPQLCIDCMRCCKVCGPHARTFDAMDVREYLEKNYSRRRSIEYFL